MLGPLTESLLSAFQNGVAILLIGTVFTVIVTRLYDTDENGVRIRDLYRNKRLVLALAIILPLSSAVLFGYTQPLLVRSFQDPRLLVTGVGVLLPLLLIRTNDEAENWNVFDGNHDTFVVIGLSLLLIFGPWFGLPLINYVVKQVTKLIKEFVNYIVGGISTLIHQISQSIIRFAISLPLQEIGAVIVFLLILIVAFRR